MIFLKDHSKEAIVYDGEKISYSHILRNVKTYSRLIPKGHDIRVSIFAENRPEWIYVIYSSWEMQAAPVIFDYNSEVNEIAYILNETTPQLIFYSDNYKNRLDTVIPLLSYNPELVPLDGLLSNAKRESLVCEVEQLDMEKTALIVYTSGTTKSPKGVMLSFNNLAANIKPILEFINPEDNVPAILPLYHIFPLMWTLILPLYAGAKIVLIKSMDPKNIMQAVQDNRVSGIIGVPKLFSVIRDRILREIKKNYFRRVVYRTARIINALWFSRMVFRKVHEKFGGNIRYLICGGAAIDPDIEKDFRTLGFEFQTGYGLTETAPMISFNKPGRIRIGSVGEPIESNEVKIVLGEIVVKGSNVMKGYFNKKEETKSVMKNGWFYTGDMGYMENGYLYITGRKDEMIVLSNGKNINPARIEESILAVSDLVKEIVVVNNNNKLSAYIYPDHNKIAGSSDTIWDIIRSKVINIYNNNAPAHKRISSFHITRDEFPKTSLEKVKRYKLVPIEISDTRDNLSAGE